MTSHKVKMNVIVSRTETVHVEASDIIKNCIDLVKSNTEFGNRYLAHKDGKIWVAEDEDYYHGSVGTKYIRLATKDDKWASNMINQLRSLHGMIYAKKSEDRS